jgi:phosphoribosylformylglycinamidine synthase I
MKRVAVLQFPGTNSEYETVRALQDAGMHAEFFRWNQDPKLLNDFDGFVVAGGFSYEDRGRSGLIASKDPIMQEIRKQAALGKPVLGICNGAQILVETGLVPGGDHNQLLMCLARNKRVRKGELLGVGFYNADVTLKSTAPKGRTAFTLDYDENELASAPAAHGEGRFTTRVQGLLEALQANQQIVFRYADEQGNIDPDFPVNPNGAMDNAAAICNPQGNVMAIMPHPERAPLAPMPKIFTSMRKYMEGQVLQGGHVPLTFTAEAPALESYTHKPNTAEIYVRLVITDNEAQTLESALRQNGFNVRLHRWMHYEVEHPAMLPGDQLEFAHALVNSGELLNLNKEAFTFVLDGMAFPKKAGASYFLTRDYEDSVGRSKTLKLRHHLDANKVQAVHHGCFWEVEGDVDMDALLATNIFANHHAQQLWRG